MELIADILLIAGALGAGLYCVVLSRRLNRFTNLESGMGGAVAVLSVQVDELTKALETAQATSRASAETLQQLTGRAEAATARMELVLASMHDLGDLAPDESPRGAAVRPPRSAIRRSRRARASSVTEAAE